MLRRLLFVLAIVPLAAVALAPVASASASTPASCAAVKASNAGATDGSYTLAPAGPTGPRASLFCGNMASATSAPTLFLVLQRTGSGQNFSQFTVGGTISGTTVVTSYTAIRLDPTPVSTSPVTFRANIADQTFATTTGSACCLGPEHITSMPYATAADCNTPFSATGVADIDLTGTGFVLASSQTFTVGGFEAAGSTIRVNPQIAVLSGGGFCGFNAPTGASGLINTDSINDANGGFDLRVSLQ
jgi:hypothetical protein